MGHYILSVIYTVVHITTVKLYELMAHTTKYIIFEKNSTVLDMN